MKYIAIDIGSSFLKSALFDLKLCKILDQNKIPATNKMENSDANYFEIPAQQLHDAVKAVIDGYTERFGDICGVVFSTQMHGFIYCHSSREDIYISWQDSRCLNKMRESGKSYMEHLQEVFGREEMTECGVYIKPSLGLCNLYAMLHGKTREEKSGELFTLGSYLIAKLTGNNICHITNAAPLGMVNIVKGQWNEAVIKKLGFEHISLPEIAKSDFEVCGTYLSNGQELKIYPDFGDQQTAILGCMAGEKDVVINIATASQISSTTDRFIPGPYETRPYFEGKYINTISNMPSGRNLDVLIDFIKAATEKIASTQVKTEQIWKTLLESFQYNSNGLKVNMGFYCTPDQLNGGGINGIRPHNFDLNTLFSAAFENMAETYGKNIKVLCGEGKKVDKLVCSGGVSWRIPQLLRIISQITGYDHALSAIPDEVFSGLFRVALVCTGVCENLNDKKEITLKQEGKEYECLI
jgi:sugar (pentulose or hexulose) kinase